MPAPPPPRNALPDALAAGSLPDLLHALHALRVINAAHHTKRPAEALQKAWRAYDDALAALLRLTVPIALLARAEPVDPALHRVLATVRANLAPPTPHRSKRAPPAPALRLPALPDADALAEAAATVADAAAAAADEIAEAWATLAPGAAVTHATLPAALRAAQHLVDSVGVGAGDGETADAAGLELWIGATRRTATRLRRDALSHTLSAVEADTAERAAGPRSAAAARTSLLAARAAATAAKTRLVRAETEEMTYTPDKVAELQRVDAELAEREVALDARLRDALTRLGRYRALGPRFEHAVDEYARVSAKLEQKLWSRNELGIGDDEQF